MTKNFVGFHVNNAGLSNYSNILKGIKLVTKNEANFFQIFFKPPYKVFSRDYVIDPQDRQIPKFHREIDKNQLQFMVHGAYVINFARDPESLTSKRGRKSLVNDLVNCYTLGGLGVVIHMGKNVKVLDLSHQEALLNYVKNIKLTLEDYQRQISKTNKNNIKNSGRRIISNGKIILLNKERNNDLSKVIGQTYIPKDERTPLIMTTDSGNVILTCCSGSLMIFFIVFLGLASIP